MSPQGSPLHSTVSRPLDSIWTRSADLAAEQNPSTLQTVVWRYITHDLIGRELASQTQRSPFCPARATFQSGIAPSLREHLIQSQVCSDNQPVVVGQRIRVGWWRQALKLSLSLVVRSKFGTPTLATKKFNLNVVGGGFTLSPFMHLYPGQQVANAS